MADLQKDLANVDHDAFALAVEAQIKARLSAFAEGVAAYRKHPSVRTLADPPTIWSEGSTRVLDYASGSEQATPVLVVPSLINRAYVLDLLADRSLMRYLAHQGLRPLLVDWGTPGAEEHDFDLTDYIDGRLGRILTAINSLAGRPPAIIGYCMGGNLVLPLAQQRPPDIAALVLMATPWDFSAMDRAATCFLGPMTPQINAVLDTLGHLPVDILQGMFAALDPCLASRKFRSFAALDQASKQAGDFVALEDWLNDGVPLVAAVARECLFDWYGANTPGRGVWHVAGHVVSPKKIKARTLVVVPERDYIVPPASAAPLSSLIPNAQTWSLPLGHIGMVAGRKGPDLLYRPLAAWLGSIPA